MFPHLRLCFILVFVVFFASAQESAWYSVKWTEKSNVSYSYKTWRSLNYSDFRASDASVAMRFVYSLQNVSLMLDELNENPYLGYKPEFGDELGFSFSGLAKDTLVLKRNGHEEDRFPLALNDTIELWLLENFSWLSINGVKHYYSSFGGFLEARSNRVNLICGAMLLPPEVMFSKEAQTSVKKPLISVNGAYSDTDVWYVCGDAEIYIDVEGVDAVYWKSKDIACKGCKKASIAGIDEGEVKTIDYALVNFFNKLDTVFGKVEIRRVESELIKPEPIFLCDNELKEVKIDNAQSVIWYPNIGVKVSCKTCNPVMVSASRSAVLIAEVLTLSGCKEVVSIPVNRSVSPVASHLLVEEFDARGNLVMVFRSVDAGFQNVTWQDREGRKIYGNKATLELKEPINGGVLTHRVDDDYCGYASEDIEVNYPVISPLSFTVNMVSENQIAYKVQPKSCSDCMVEWDFGDTEKSVLKEGLHTFSSSGFYDVTVSVQDRFGRKEKVLKKIFVP